MTADVPVPSPAAPARLRVLIVEDSEVDARVLVSLLRQGGWQVTFRRVEDGPAMAAALASDLWDLVLADHSLPGFSAPEALRLLQGTGRDLPFIIVSGGIEEGVAIAAMKAGAHDFLMKGALGRLVPAVQRELREASVRAARRSAEEALRESELRYRSVWENSTDAVLLVDLEGIVRFANPAVGPVFGRDPGTVVDRPLVELAGAAGGGGGGDWWGRARAGGHPVFEAEIRRPDGRPVSLELAFTEMRTGDQLWMVAFVRDITERLRAEEELRQSREEFAAAREVQQRLFPRSAPEVPGLEIDGISHPAAAAGGDYFDYLVQPDGSLLVAVADVSGHGLGPALLMAEARAFLRLLARREGDPGVLLTETNAALASDLGAERFITLALARYEPATRVLRIASAGHPPVHVIGPDGGVKHVVRRTGPPLGRRPGEPCRNAADIVLQPGDMVLMVTDGIDEATDAAGTECFGFDRAVAVVARNAGRPVAEIIARLCSEVRDFSAPAEPTDDLTAVVLRAG